MQQSLPKGAALSRNLFAAAQLKGMGRLISEPGEEGRSELMTTSELYGRLRGRNQVCEQDLNNLK